MIINTILDTIVFLDDIIWSYLGWSIITIVGIYMTYISRGLQFRALFNMRSNLINIYSDANSTDNKGVHPFKLYFASAGGMVGLGNVVFISMAMMIGGPGTLLWTVIASICGMLLKYSESYLGVKYRIKNPDGSFSGGPMYFLQKAFKTKVFAYIFAFLLCLYGVEISNFLIIVDRIEHTFHFNRYTIIFTLLVVVLCSSIGGIRRLANICSTMMPVFMLGYIVFSIYVILANYTMLPTLFKTIIFSAFTGHAPIGGFVGSTMIMSAYLGISKTVYSGDIGIGYESIVQSETQLVDPKQHATLSIYSLLMDSLICILTNTMIGVTGAWYTLNSYDPSDVVAKLLSDYIPYSDIFMTILFFVAGFTTIIAYLTAGIKCAEFISPRIGKKIYLLYSVFAFIFFCHFSQKNVMIIMSFLSGLLVMLNIYGILKLRKQIEF